MKNSSKDIDNMSILVNSCDLYEDAWYPFFKLLKIQWPECEKHQIILNTETKTYNCDFLNVRTFCGGKNIPWSKRLKDCLATIDTEFILFFLEDFFLEGTVNQTILSESFKCMSNDNNVGVIKFVPNVSSTWYDKSITIYNYFSPVYKKCSARNAGLAALWRKDYYIKLLRDFEDPWEFETFGAIRSRKYTESILVQNDNAPLAFPYNIQIKYGYGISQRKWLKNNKTLFEKYDIKVNFDNLGWYEETSQKKIVGLHRPKKEKILMPFTNPKLFFKIIGIEFKRAWYFITHIRNLF